jgi:hypothetical protein
VKCTCVSRALTIAQEGSEEELVACGRGVAAATIRLVTAARAKADPFSPTQRDLAAAAKNVQTATDDLVAHAKTYSEITDTDTGPDLAGMSDVKVRSRWRLCDSERDVITLRRKLLMFDNKRTT